MGSTMLPSTLGQQGTPNMLGMNPNLYSHYMEFQQNNRMNDATNQLPEELTGAAQHTAHQPNVAFANNNIAGMTPPQPFNTPGQPQPYTNTPQPTGLASLPGLGQFGKGIV